jgi:uncharacterized protein (TIGR02001 family)
MKSKLLLVLAAALSVGAVSSFGQAAATSAAPASSWKITPAVVSQYMFRGVRLSGPALQPSVEYTSGDLTSGIWASVPLDKTVPGQSDPEIDFYGSYNIVAIKDVLTIVPGATLYAYPDADKNLGFYGMTFEPSIAFNYTTGGITVTPKAYYDFVLDGFTWEISGSASLPLPSLGTELAFSATFGTYKWNDALERANPSVRNRGDYWSVGVSAPYAIAANQKLTLGVAYHEGINNKFSSDGSPTVSNALAMGRAVISASYSFSF